VADDDNYQLGEGLPLTRCRLLSSRIKLDARTINTVRFKSMKRSSPQLFNGLFSGRFARFIVILFLAYAGVDIENPHLVDRCGNVSNRKGISSRGTDSSILLLTIKIDVRCTGI
jgi:hypothetical protein